MPAHDIIVIGASAGGVEALQKLVADLPSNLPAAVFVVLHLYPRGESFLPRLLSRAGRLTALHPTDGTRIQHGQIYVAPPDHHLLIEDDHVHLGLGPKEQHQRPCINVTFRSAALAYAGRVTGVILTGQLDDGVAGLWEVKRRGGVAVVHHPEEASFPSMPLSALREVEVDYTVRLADMAPLLTRLAVEDSEVMKSKENGNEMKPTVTDLTCPDCRGTIWESAHGSFHQFRCRVGHVFSPKSMLAEHFAVQEKVLYSAVALLEEGASLASRLSRQLGPELESKLLDEARERGSQAEIIRKLLESRKSFSLD